MLKYLICGLLSLCFQLEKVLQQGDVSDVAEPYLTKDDKVSAFVELNGKWIISSRVLNS